MLLEDFENPLLDLGQPNGTAVIAHLPVYSSRAAYAIITHNDH